MKVFESKCGSHIGETIEQAVGYSHKKNTTSAVVHNGIQVEVTPQSTPSAVQEEWENLRARIAAEDETLRSGNMTEIARVVHQLARDKGWYNDESETENQYVERMCNNLHDEVSELHEAWRNGLLHEYCDKTPKMLDLRIEPLTCLEEELADLVIRVFDNSQRLGVDILSAIRRKHQFNRSRQRRHGGKLS